MIPHFTNNAYTSVLMWADNRLTNQQQAYINKTTRLSYQRDPAIEAVGKVAYASPYRQWVYDSGVNGATIINSISGANISLSRGQSGLSIDYVGGRVLLDSGVGTGLNITGSYAVKEVNMYMANVTQDQLLTTEKFNFNPRYSTPTGVLPPYAMTTPAMFLSHLSTQNEPYALGGLDMTKSHLSFTVFAEKPYQMDAIFGCFADARYKWLPIVSIGAYPLNEFGDTKRDYSYNDTVSTYGQPGNLMYVEEVTTSQVSDIVKMNQALFKGVVDITVCYPRHSDNLL